MNLTSDNNLILDPQMILEIDEEIQQETRKSNRRHRIEGKKDMKLITCNYPQEWIEFMDELVRAGRFANRSELLRYAVKQLLDEELILVYFREKVYSKNGENDS
jgi:hypothetical protein